MALRHLEHRNRHHGHRPSPSNLSPPSPSNPSGNTTHRHSFSDMYEVDPAHYLHREFDRGVYHTSDFQDRVAATLGLAERGGAPEYQFYYLLWPNMYLQGASSWASEAPSSGCGPTASTVGRARS